MYSRDEMKQWQMAHSLDSSRVTFVLGDVRDSDRLAQAMRGVDYVVHAAATKIVPTAERNPSETIKTNILGAMNVADQAVRLRVKKLVALSTDKASSPINLYGASKLASDKIFMAADNNRRQSQTRFTVVRYGNVMGSRGSVIPFFLEKKEKGEALPITDERMTRFMISLDEAVETVHGQLWNEGGGNLVVKKIPSMNILEIANAVWPGGPRKVVGLRPGEKLHEQMVASEESNWTWDTGEHFEVIPEISDEEQERLVNIGARKVAPGFGYSSDSNSQWLSEDSLGLWISRNFLSAGGGN